MQRRFFISLVLLGILVLFVQSAQAQLMLLPETDMGITRKVELALMGLSGAYAIDTEDGVVTLVGAMEDQEHVNVAASRVLQVPGVVGVNNELRVEPQFFGGGWEDGEDAPVSLFISSGSLSDDDIANNVSRRLRPYRNVSVNVDNGTAVLSGVVPGWVDKERVGRIAGRVPGVHGVRNDVQAEEGSETF